MSITKFTPGKHYAINYGGFIVMQANWYYMRDGDLLNEETCPEAEANGKLYAAATGLLQFAEMFKAHYEGNSNWKEVYEKCNEVIKAATL